MAEQIEGLEEAVDRARQSRFYSDRIVGHPVRGLDDLRRLPFTRRSDLEAAGLDGLLAVPRARLWQYHESSGSTGRPISTWYTERDRATALVALKRLPIALGPGVLLLNRLPYAFVALSHFLEAWVRETGAAIAPAGNLNWTVPFPRAIDLIARLRPQMIACLPFELLVLRELAPEVGASSSEIVSLETVLTAGGLLPPALRRLIERDWGARVRNVYGSTEALGLGSECSAGRMHLHTDLFVCEIVEPRSLAPLDEGEREGIFVLTSLAQEAMPLVRYVTEDVVRFSDAPCSCGSPRPTIEVLGRAGEMLEYGGKVLSPYDLLDAAYDFAADHGGRILFVVGLSAGLRLRVESPRWREGFAAESLERLRARLGVPVDVDLVRPGELLPHPPLLEMPRGYKPTMISDWRNDRRRPYTLADAMLTRPDLKLSTGLKIAGWALRNRYRRWRLGATAMSPARPSSPSRPRPG